MTDSDARQGLTAGAVAQALGGRLEGDPSAPVTGISGLRGARRGEVSFVADKRYLPLAAGTQAALLVLPDGLDLPQGASVPVVRVSSVETALETLAALFTPPPPPRHPGPHPTAVIGADVELGQNASVGPCAVIEDGARIGANTTVGPQVFVGRNAVIGEDTHLHPGVHVCERCRIGSRVVLHPGVVIGGEGFGYVFRGRSHLKIPQIGIVDIADDVEIGANTTIDRARFGATRVGRGTKIDNLVMIAHNVQIGEHCIITGQVGIAGSTSIGDYVMLGARAGLLGHLTIGEKSMIGAGSGVARDVPPGAKLFGVPAEPRERAWRIVAAYLKLPELVQRVRELSRKIDALGKPRGEEDRPAP